MKYEQEDEFDCEDDDDIEKAERKSEEENYLENFKVFSPDFAKRSIKIFFQDVSLGKNYKLEDLMKDKFCNLIINLQLAKSLEIGYKLVKNAPLKHVLSIGNDRKDDPEILIFLNISRRAADLKMPKRYVGGLFLMWLHFCENLEIKMFN
jgi:hypothetical protein